MVSLKSLLRASLVMLTLAGAAVAQAPPANFDLSGPPIDVRVSRAGKTLPIAEVPNLLAGDRVWVHPVLPADQAAHYLLIVCFLRGATNPPPPAWFTRASTWEKKIQEEGVFVVVPEGAEQALIFLAPETGGDFTTLRSAVRGRPGSFVRAAQDLSQTSLDRSRLEAYLAAVRQIAEQNPDQMHDKSVLLARSLSIRLDDDCFKRPIDQQAPCLIQKGNDLVLADGHSQTMVGALTSGTASDLVGQLAYTPQGGSGYFSPYIGAIMDMGRILDSLHTAQYQYIPALALAKKDQLELKLNNAPSFHNPKSVIVVALPLIKASQPPPLRAVDAKQVSCLQKSATVLQVSGAPLVFSTEMAHDMVLHLPTKTGSGVDLPVKVDAARGGYVIDTHSLASTAAKLDFNQTDAVVQGYWGFDKFTGPSFKLQNARKQKWTVDSDDGGTLVVGKPATLHLHSDEASCVEAVTVKDQQGTELKADWKVTKPDAVEVKVPLESARAGAVTVRVKEAGLEEPDQVPLHAYIQAAHLDQFTISPGDAEGMLRGSRVDEVANLELQGITFAPTNSPAKPAASGFHGPDDPHGSGDMDLQLAAPNGAATAALKADGAATAKVKLKDGRTLEVPVKIASPRPRVTLLNKSIQPGNQSMSSAVRLTNKDELPLDGQLFFSMRSEVPKNFPRTEKIEIATEDGSFDAQLSVADGTLTLQDPQTILATLDPTKKFGNSAFGKLRYRPVDETGVTGDWQPLAFLVRVPSLKELRCPADASQPCTLSGANLFLLQAVASDTDFAHQAAVPQGFVGSTLGGVPHPGGDKVLYIKLRDDPSDVNTAVVPVVPGQQQGAGQAGQSSEGASAGVKPSAVTYHRR